MPMKLASTPLGASLLLLAAAAGLTLGACGYPKFSFDPAGIGTSSGAGGAGGSTAGTGGDAATSSVAVTSAAAASSSSGNGCVTTGLSTCTAKCGCLVEEKCAVTDENAGTMTCIAAGPVVDWAKCNANEDCGASSFCDHTLKVCKPLCNGAGKCPPNAQCIAAQQSDGKTDIVGLKVCTAHCDPIKATPCGQNLTCFYDFDTVEFDCAAGPNSNEGIPCKLAIDCAKGLVCAGSTGNYTCSQWCTPIGSTKNAACPAVRPYCRSLATNVTYEGTDYGICRATP